MKVTDSENNKNKGTGAGGANTNINGLSFEDKTSLENVFTIVRHDTSFDNKNKYPIVKFNGYDKEFVCVKKRHLYKFMEAIGEKNKNLEEASGCKQPDEAYIDTNNNFIYIIEKKYQQRSGSVDEKIQTGPFKKHHYSEQFPNYKVKYIYCLSDWFKQSEYKSVLDYIQKNDVPIFWGDEQSYKDEIIKLMCSNQS